jgi:hypothetical protein
MYNPNNKIITNLINLIQINTTFIKTIAYGILQKIILKTNKISSHKNMSYIALTNKKQKESILHYYLYR